ncbi:MAG: SsrA-binding protein, partial [Phycisphaerae bacterium]|nr:SsrA-binding protein [Phycisphaerae bacterium]
AEYPPAAPATQHVPARPRVLLAHRREIRKWANWTRERGTTIVPLKVYFVGGRIKLLVGLGVGKKKYDKRQAIKARDAARDMERRH